MRDEKSRLKYIAVALFICALVAIGLFADPVILSLTVFIGIYGIITLGMTLLMGYAGQISLAANVFVGIGAYTTALVTTRLHLSAWLALVMGIVISVAVAIILGRAILRTRGLILACVTTALALIFTSLAVNLVDFTGGMSGIPGIPRLSIGGIVLRSDLHYYILVWIIALLLLAFSYNVVNSRVGRALRSIDVFAGGSEEAAETLAINVANYKLQVFTLSAVYASIAGSIYAHYLTTMHPSPVDIHLSILVMIMAVVGGMGKVWGAFLGAALILGIREIMRSMMPMFVGGVVGAYVQIAYAIILLLVLLFLPGGLVSIPQRLSSVEGGEAPFPTRLKSWLRWRQVKR